MLFAVKDQITNTGMQRNSLNINDVLNIESTNFLAEVFNCKDGIGVNPKGHYKYLQEITIALCI